MTLIDFEISSDEIRSALLRKAEDLEESAGKSWAVNYKDKYLARAKKIKEFAELL